jgi:SAM-dependent methyltransferase
MRELAIEPPVPPIECAGEDLLERFEPGAFDLAVARNSVDHATDPLRLLRNMIELVRDDGYVLLRHLRTQGERHRYSGLHQWNLGLEEEGDLMLWRTRRDRVRVSEALGEGVLVDSFADGPWIVTVIARSEQGRPASGQRPTGPG